jgi:hypothetical protein
MFEERDFPLLHELIDEINCLLLFFHIVMNNLCLPSRVLSIHVTMETKNEKHNIHSSHNEPNCSFFAFKNQNWLSEESTRAEEKGEERKQTKINMIAGRKAGTLMIFVGSP